MIKECYFDKKATELIKGILLILMFILHFFCFPSWYVDGIEYSYLSWLEKYQGHFQICIAGFTFLTGYLYYFTKEKTFRYIVKKWKDILLPYWLVFFILFSVAILTNTYSGNIKIFLLEIFTVEQPVMFFCWYVSYYLVMIGALWLIVKFIKNDTVKWIIALIGSYILYWCCLRFIHIDFIVSTTEKLSVYFPMTVTGFICAKRRWLEKVRENVGNKNIIYAILFIVIVFMEPSWLYKLKINSVIFELTRKCIRIISIPLFMYGLIEIAKKLNNKILGYLLGQIGKYSMLMWFVHSIFFNCSKEIFQRILYLPQWPIVVLVWGLVLCWAVSILIDFILGRLKKWK